ncbi:MFS transporter [Sinomonas sp. ASV486]|uniref:MFS transporter n=1 Tax=Sinomonas sp. ASV486 TaxID=3051170 RepID=UPI0027DB5401|nr:MFS transporter [Sinomonas sp. ASV486]MDQ4490820.1 MFS transporter [Sinomonas sp. ASV486]
MSVNSVADNDPSTSSSLPDDVTVRGHKGVFVRLTAMMLLEFVVFGSWFATLGLVLATNNLPAIIGTAYSLAAVAAIVSPMFLGAIGDRFLSSQKVLALAHLAGGVVMLFLPAVVSAGNGSLALVLIFVYMLFFQPTLGLANSIAFRHVGTNQRAFPYIRVFGTIGWVIAGLLVGGLGLSASSGIFYVTAAASLLFGLYSFTLPHTPAPAKGARFALGDVIGAKAFRLFRHRNFVVLMICAVLTSISLGVYNTFSSPYLGALGISNVAGVLAIGQASEVAFIITIPWVLSKVGMKWGLFFGMVLWGVRFALFIAAAGDSLSWLAIVAIAMHGICNDFFLVLAAMYIDRVAPVDLTAQAQSMLILVISGIGAFVGATVSGTIFGEVVAPNAAAGPAAWTPIWLVPIGTAILTAFVWTIFFRYSRNHEIVRMEPSAAQAK